MNRLGQLLDAEINGALADAVAVGVTVKAGQRAWLADGKHDVVKLAGICRNHCLKGAQSVAAGGIFVRRQVAGVGLA